jgi:hypothetical protein
MSVAAKVQGLLIVALLFLACGRESMGSELIDPARVAASFDVGRLVDDFGFGNEPGLRSASSSSRVECGLSDRLAGLLGRPL